jgi:hypothetical protein
MCLNTDWQIVFLNNGTTGIYLTSVLFSVIYNLCLKDMYWALIAFSEY